MQDSTTCGKTRIYMDEAKTREAYITNNIKKETEKKVQKEPQTKNK